MTRNSSRRSQIDRLSADHACRPGRDRQQLHGAKPARRVGRVRVRREHARGRTRDHGKRFGEQAIAGKNRESVAVHDVGGRPATAQFVVVHRRQIVMNQRIGMNHLHGDGRGQRKIARVRRADACGGAGRFRRRQRQAGPQTLAAGHQRIAHRVRDEGRRAD